VISDTSQNGSLKAYINGGRWNRNVVTAGTKGTVVKAGSYAWQDPSDSYYEVRNFADTLSHDLCDATYQPGVCTGTVPDGGAVLKVAFTASGTWDGKTRRLADLSGLANLAQLTVEVADVPAQYADGFELAIFDGILCANRLTGDEVFRAGPSYYTTWADAYNALASGQTLKVLKDVALDKETAVDKKFTLDLNGHTLTQTSSGHFFLIGASGNLTVDGGGTIVAGLALFRDRGYVTVSNCTLRGTHLLSSSQYSGGVQVTVASEQAVLDLTYIGSLWTPNGSATINSGKVTCAGVNVISDTSQNGSLKAYINGGRWNRNVVTAGTKGTVVKAGSYAWQDSSDGYYEVRNFADTLAYDLCDATYQPGVCTGTVPDGGAVLKIAFTASGTWNGRRRCIADLSALGNLSALTFEATEVPEDYAKNFELKLLKGKLYAKRTSGLFVLVR